MKISLGKTASGLPNQMGFSLGSAIKKPIIFIIKVIFYMLMLPLVLFLTVFMPKKRSTLIWGTVPLTNNKYWSMAVSALGYESMTLMEGYYHIHKKEDFDLYFEDITPGWIRPRRLRQELGQFFAFAYILRNASVLHLNYLGGPLWNTWFWRIEGWIYRHAGIKTVVLPFGGDFYMYSQIMDTSVRHGLLLSYPHMAKREREIRNRVEHWTEYADVIVACFSIDAIPRWDVPVGGLLSIDIDEWCPKEIYSSNDGVNGVVRILHAPNRRGVKGTEYFVKAVEELKKEGLKIELVLLEGVPNEKVKETIIGVDILADQLILPGYGLFGIEGLASGLPVLSNLENELYTKLFRRFSFLNECPVLSTSPESAKANLRALITDPDLRESLGRASRKYAEYYHSNESAGYLFGSIYDKLLKGKDVDLMNLFHPLKSDYVRDRRVPNPLVDNKLPLGDRESY